MHDTKKLVNSWSTSKRLHEPIMHNCPLSCTFEDDLLHYLVCRTLWDILCSAARLGRAHLNLSPLGGGLKQPNTRKLLLVAGAFEAYHAIKLQHLESALSAHALGGDPSPCEN